MVAAGLSLIHISDLGGKSSEKSHECLGASLQLLLLVCEEIMASSSVFFSYQRHCLTLKPLLGGARLVHS